MWLSFARAVRQLLAGQMLGRLRLLAPRGARLMSGHSIEHAIAETDKWKKISFVGKRKTLFTRKEVEGISNTEHPSSNGTENKLQISS